MKILRSDKNDSKDLFLSQKIPTVLKNTIDYSVKNSRAHNFSDEELKEISKFYNNNNRVDNSNSITSVSFNDLKRFLNLKPELLVIYVDGKILGCIITIIFPANIETELNKEVLVPKHQELIDFYNPEDVLITGCASYLILDMNHRRKGLGMALIQESLSVLHKNIGGVFAYFMNSKSRCNNSIPINIWYFPLNLKKLDECKFPYPRNYKRLFNLDGEINNSIIVDKNNSEKAYNFYINYVKNKKFKFLPGLTFWNKWIESFPTYITVTDGNINGIFSFNSNKMWHSSYMTVLNTGYILFCLGDQPSTLKKSLFQAKMMFDIINIYPVGDLTDRYLSQVFAQKNGKLYINFYNLNIFLTAQDFYSPLF